MATQSVAPPVAASVAIKNILFATDFSESSHAALSFAVAIGRRRGGTLFVAHVMPAEGRPPISIESRPMELDLARHHSQQQMEKLERSGALRDVPHEPILRHGHIWEALCEIVASRSIDLIVIGTHGRTGLRKLVLGSSAEKIFRSARRPVLTVGPHVRPGLLHDGRFAHIVFATDFTAGSLHALSYAIWLAREDEACLTLLHCLRMPGAIPVEFGTAIYDDEEAAAVSRTSLQQLVAAAALPRDPAIVVRAGFVPELILEAAQDRNADLIVMGLHHHRPAAACHNPWTTADYVVCRAQCPVLTVRAD